MKDDSQCSVFAKLQVWQKYFNDLREPSNHDHSSVAQNLPQALHKILLKPLAPSYCFYAGIFCKFIFVALGFCLR